MGTPNVPSEYQDMVNNFVDTTVVELENLPMMTSLTSLIAIAKKSVKEIKDVKSRTGSILYDEFVSSPVKKSTRGIRFYLDAKHNVISQNSLKSLGIAPAEDIKADTPVGMYEGYTEIPLFGRGFTWTGDDEDVVNNLGSWSAKLDYIKSSLTKWKNNIGQGFGWQALYGRGIKYPLKENASTFNTAITDIPENNEMNGLFTYLFDNTFDYQGISMADVPQWRVNTLTFGSTANWLGYTSANVDTRAELLAFVSSDYKIPVILDILGRYLHRAYRGKLEGNNAIVCVSPNMYELIQQALDYAKYVPGTMTNDMYLKMQANNEGDDFTSTLMYKGFPIVAMHDGYDNDGGALYGTGVNSYDFTQNWWPDNKIAILNLDDFELYQNEIYPFEFKDEIDVPGVWFKKLSTFSGSMQIVNKMRSRQTLITFPSALTL